MRRTLYDGTTLHIRIHDSVNHSDRPVLRGDIQFYRNLAQRANGEVLEVGVGTGRVAVELAKAGIRVTGLDISEAMLAIAAEKGAASTVADRLRLECGDMRNFDLGPRKFELIIVPYRAFQLLLTPEDQLAALAAFRRHLRRNGILVLHLFDPDLRFLLPGASPPIDLGQGTDRDTGRPVEVVVQTDSLDHVNQIRRELWHYRVLAADGTIAERKYWSWQYAGPSAGRCGICCGSPGSVSRPSSAISRARRPPMARSRSGSRTRMPELSARQ